ncbi:hypothetical protein EUGRSUZ_B00426 [Eucalyptus grandis]|uniref:Uncharacterized protein n=2 Tax=Eucalyptus grandis TaxID=71139 RepID=A0ACC3LM37_EUCGR|nr:hypothetical protein EUGRSUZ_B00426 [Eucalyptus grandis]
MAPSPFASLKQCRTWSTAVTNLKTSCCYPWKALGSHRIKQPRLLPIAHVLSFGRHNSPDAPGKLTTASPSSRCHLSLDHSNPGFRKPPRRRCHPAEPQSQSFRTRHKWISSVLSYVNRLSCDEESFLNNLLNLVFLEKFST